MKPRYKNDQERILRNVDRSGECWIWTAEKSRLGYGVIRLKKGAKIAHRFSYEVFNGPIADKLCIMHTCDVRACVNPSHLQLGTHAENMRDMAIKGRAKNGYSTGNYPKITNRVAITHCKHGHELTPDNLVPSEKTRRRCLACCRKRSRERGRRVVPRKKAK